jgi:hypothetical protein
MLTLGIGVVGLAIDVFTLGSGSVIKGGIKAGVKTGVKELAEAGTKELVEQTAKTALKKSEQVAINRAVGKAAEEVVTKTLVKKYGAKNVGTQITARFADGSAVVFDNVVIKEGKIVMINETKSGTAKLTKQQARFFENGEKVTFVGKNADELRIKGRSISKKSEGLSLRETRVEKNEISGSKNH